MDLKFQKCPWDGWVVKKGRLGGLGDGKNKMEKKVVRIISTAALLFHKSLKVLDLFVLTIWLIHFVWVTISHCLSSFLIGPITCMHTAR